MANANTTTLIDQAKEVLRKQRGTAEDLFDLAKSLKKIQKFNLARRVLALSSHQQANPELSRKIVQQLASCTEKDPDLPLDRRYEEARKIIDSPLKEAEVYIAAAITTMPPRMAESTPAR